MTNNYQTKEELEAQMEEIDEAIITHSKIIEKLKMQRYELFSVKLDLEIVETLECAVENDISPRRIMDLIISEIGTRDETEET